MPMAVALSELRRLLPKRGQLAAYIIPTDDAHQSEYIADCDKRREFISSFTGSAGIVIVTPSEALLWTDGRYHLQASKELDLSLWTLMRQGDSDVLNPDEWLGQKITKGQKIGYDPSLIAHSTIKKYTKSLEEGCGGVLTPIKDNLVDLVWAKQRPPPPNSDLIILDVKYAGRTWQQKVEDVRKEMQTNNAALLLVTALDEVAWLFNLRGSDIDYNPVFFGYAIVTLTSVRLFISEERTRLSSLQNHLVGVKLLPYTTVLDDLQDLIKEAGDSKIWISDSSAEVFVQCVPHGQRCSLLSPIQLLKGVKNATEICGMKACHVRDCAALCEYLCWLEEEVPKGCLNEVTAANKLDSLRKALPDYVSLSFPTISSSGPNGAVIHYQPNVKTARALSTSELYLCDSGGQYLDGTTDVTRTVTFGTPSMKEKEAFTLVLKGHIALCTAIFPDKTFGNQVDCLARAALWQQGLDYKHGTGHGVGAFLNVHEGPHGIGKSRPNIKPLQAGMFVTDEPGYYEDEAFGVRIENVELVKKVDTKYQFNNTNFLTMEPVTLAYYKEEVLQSPLDTHCLRHDSNEQVPIQQKMIELSLLTEQEIKWLDGYHEQCYKTVGQYLQEVGKQHVEEWLKRETSPLPNK